MTLRIYSIWWYWGSVLPIGVLTVYSLVLFILGHSFSCGSSSARVRLTMTWKLLLYWWAVYCWAKRIMDNIFMVTSLLISLLVRWTQKLFGKYCWDFTIIAWFSIVKDCTWILILNLISFTIDISISSSRYDPFVSTIVLIHSLLIHQWRIILLGVLTSHVTLRILLTWILLISWKIASAWSILQILEFSRVKWYWVLWLI